jgi:glutathione S-transferase
VLELYQFEGCPFCSKVRTRLCDLGIDYVARIVPRDRSLREKLEEISGQRSVPVLVDPKREEVISDSDIILEYLEKNYGS